MEKKLVSVIMPAYNAGAYIGGAIESLLAQTYDKLEILIIDDGSQDGTLSVAEKYAQTDKRVRVIKTPNGGVSAARNKGLELATGEYIFFLDSDDTAEPYAVERLVDALETTGADLVNCSYSRWGEKGTKLNDYDFATGEFETSSMEQRLEFVVKKLLPYRIGYEVWNKLYKADIIKNNRICFDTDCRIGEDLAFNMKYITKAAKITCIPDRCVKYLVREDSAMGNTKALSKKLSEDGLLLKGFCEYISQEGNSVFTDGFPLILVRVLDSAYIEHTPDEVVGAFAEINGEKPAELIKEFYREIDRKKDEITALYQEEIAKIKYRYHLYVRARLGAGKTFDRCGLLLYDVYRKLRKRELLKTWKMPY